MSSTFVDLNDVERLARLALPFDQRPHGIVPPPKEIQELVAQEKARLQPWFNEEAERRTLEDWTLQYYFEGTTIAYRRTDQGPEILAVGEEELGKVFAGKSQDEILKIIVRQP